jgi:hypothetical protein
MDYELANELNDAGFPHACNPMCCSVEPGCVYVMPTLEELIEACALPNDFVLENWSDTWFASNKSRTTSGHGDSSTEAVARLWLALHKKQ